MSRRLVNVMDELCANCGLTFGSHCGDGRGPLCPGHEDRMNWDQGPGTKFEATGMFHEVLRGTPAQHKETDA